MISLHCIVKNEEKLLGQMLRSVRDFVSEMIVVDTGSTDYTVELAKSLGARVEHFDWCDDFSAARNYALSFVKTPWTIWLDADDIVLNPEILEAITTEAHKNQIAALWGTYRQDETCTQKRMQIFKPSKFKWEGVVHESPTSKRPLTETAYCELVVKHNKPESRRFEACEKYLNILLEKDPENHMGIAESYKLMAVKDPEQYTPLAFDRYLKAMQHELVNAGTRYIACFHCARLALEAAKHNQTDSAAVEIAFKMANLGITIEPKRAECYVILGQLHHALGHWDEAAKLYRSALDLKAPKDMIGLVYPAYYGQLPTLLLEALEGQRVKSKELESV